MATQDIDGFDHYNAAADFYSRKSFMQWQQDGFFGTPTISFVAGLNGYGRALKLFTQTAGGPFLSWSGIRSIFATRNQEAYLGIRFNGQEGGGDANGFFMVVGDSTAVAPNQQFTIHVDETNYSISVWAGTPALGLGSRLWLSANNVWSGDVGEFLEFHIKIATGGTGILEFKINNFSLGVVNLTTQQTANAYFDYITWIASPFSGLGSYILLDDFYYNDTTSGPGTFPMNSYAGDSLVYTLFPTGNDAVQFTPLANTNWQEVSEIPMDSDVSYNSDSTVNHQDTFVCNPLLNMLTIIYSLKVTYATRNDGAGTRTIDGVVRIGGTSYVSSDTNNVPASATYAYFGDMWVLSPASGLNFTRTEVNAATYGYKLTS